MCGPLEVVTVASENRVVAWLLEWDEWEWNDWDRAVTTFAAPWFTFAGMMHLMVTYGPIMNDWARLGIALVTLVVGSVQLSDALALLLSSIGIEPPADRLGGDAGGE